VASGGIFFLRRSVDWLAKQISVWIEQYMQRTGQAAAVHELREVRQESIHQYEHHR